MASRYYQFYNEQTKHWLKIDLRKDRVKRISDKRYWRLHEISKFNTNINGMTDLFAPIAAVGAIIGLLGQMRLKEKVKEV
jgi:hypothetical protein